MTYLEEIKKSMDLLDKHKFYFIGQNMKFGGTSMFHTYKHISEERRIELPVTEEMQAGMATGMALEGLNVCSVYPRMDFLILALNQIINHLDKADEMSDGQFKPRVIIRTCVGSVKPMMPGPQHCQDYTEALKNMAKNINIVALHNAEDVYPAYKAAVKAKKSTILIEYSDLYNRDFAFSDIKQSKDIEKAVK